jgi:cytoskeletal protein CcmA (bactofilin family)
MFRRGNEDRRIGERATERVDSVLGAGITWRGEINGTGGVRIEGAFDGQITVNGVVVVGEQGRVTSEHIRAVSVIVSGSVKGDITAPRVEIGRTGRVWGDVTTVSFSTEEGAFLRGQITMHEELDLGLPTVGGPGDLEGSGGAAEAAEDPRHRDEEQS